MDRKSSRRGKGKEVLLNALSLLPVWLSARLVAGASKVNTTESKVSARHPRSLHSSDLGLFREMSAERDGVIVTPEELIVCDKIGRITCQDARTGADLLFWPSGGIRVE